MSGTDLVPGYLLHRRTWRDRDLLLEVLTPEAGRVGLLAPGAGSAGSRRGMLLQPFTALLLSWRGRGELARLQCLDSAAAPLGLSGKRLFCGLYVNELVVRLTRRSDPHAGLFQLYADTIGRLAVETDLELPLRHFEIGLLAELGYALQLDREAADDRPVTAGASYRYVVEQGLVPSEVGARDAVDGATLLRLARGESLDGDQRRQAKRLLRSVLDHYLGHTPVKSRELFGNLR